MKLILCVLLWFVFRHAEGAGGSEEDESAEIDAIRDIDYKKALELARVDAVYSLPPPEGQRPSNMEVAKYCRLQDVNNLLYMHQGRVSCVVKTTNQADHCKHDIKPKSIAKLKIPCGRGELQGQRYNFQYDICILHHQKPAIKEKLYATLFSICYNRTQKQPYYTEHRIASNSYNPRLVLDPKSYMERFSKNINVLAMPLLLRNIADAYQKILDDPQFDNLDYPDYLIPQTLLPATDFEPDYARGAHLTWAVVKPQYSRLSGAWNSLNEMIWQKFHDFALKAKIYTGVAANLVVNGMARTIRVLEDDNTSSEIAVPLIWWKAVKTNDVFFIVIFYNIPSGYPRATISPLCTDPENNSKANRHCLDIRTKLARVPGLFIECCSLTVAISKEINLQVAIDPNVLNPGKQNQPSTSATYVPPWKKR